VILARWLLLLLAAALTMVAIGAAGGEEQPAALRLAAAASVGVLAPLFWPGPAATPWRSLLRLLLWSLAAAAGAALLANALGRLPQPALAVAATCGLLFLLLVAVHAVVDWLDRRWPRGVGGLALAAALVLAGALPLWAGPAAELLSKRYAGALDAVVGASPLAHLAIVGGNDFLRNEWFYSRSNLAALPVAYPEPVPIAIAYALASGAALVLFHLLPRRGTGRADPPTREEPSR
jgi:hypothetical protein